LVSEPYIIIVDVIILSYLLEPFTNAARAIMRCNKYPVYICGSKLFVIMTLNLKVVRIVSGRKLIQTIIVKGYVYSTHPSLN